MPPPPGRSRCEPLSPPIDTAAYLLDGLDATEEEEFGRHLHGCRRCRAEVEELVPVVQLLTMARRYRACTGQA